MAGALIQGAGGQAATLKWDMKRFVSDIERVRNATHRTTQQVVQHNARRLVKKAAQLCPIDTGRARAGFWPAAIALKISNIYTPHPNICEGAGIDNTGAKNPTFTLENSVPYITYMGGKPGGTRGRYYKKGENAKSLTRFGKALAEGGKEVLDVEGNVVGAVTTGAGKRVKRTHGLSWWGTAINSTRAAMNRDVTNAVRRAI